MSPCLKKLILLERGATSVEYAIIASLIAGAIVGAVALLGGTVLQLFSSVQFP